MKRWTKLLQGVPPPILFFSRPGHSRIRFIFTNWIEQPKLCKGFPHVDFFSVRVTPDSESAFICDIKNKALPAEAQQLNYKYDTVQSVTQLEPGLGLCHIYNLVVDYLSLS